MSTYEAEAVHLHKSYCEAIGWALQYGIKVYYPNSGGTMKSLGDLREEIRQHEASIPRPITSKDIGRGNVDGPMDGLVQAYCTNGHPATLWGGVPQMAKPGKQVRWWGSPFYCHCGAPVVGGRR